MTKAESSAKHALSGAMASGLARAFAQPFEVVKIRFQLQSEPISKKSKGHSKYTSVGQAMVTILREEGIRAFWKGHIPAQLLSVTNGAVQFTVYERAHIFFNQMPFLVEHKNLHNFICGAVAGVTSTTIIQPFEVTKTRLIAQDNKVYKSFLGALIGIVRSDGPTGLYKGIKPAVLEVVPYTGMNFMVYRYLSEYAMKFYNVDNRHDLPMWILITMGAMCACCSKSVTYPLDMVKKRIHVHGFAEHRKGFGVTAQCTGVLYCLKTVIQQEGFLGLYKGLTPAYLKSAVSLAVQFAFYDYIITLMKAESS